MQEEEDMSEHKFLLEEQIYDMMPVDDFSCKYSETRGSFSNVIVQVLMLSIGSYCLVGPQCQDYS